MGSIVGPSKLMKESALREITEKTRPPRALFVPFSLGYPLGEPDNTELQTKVMRAAFALLTRDDCPVLESPGG